MSADLKEFRIPSTFSNALTGFIILSFIIATWLMWFVRPDQLTIQERLTVLAIIFLPMIVMLWIVKRISVKISDELILYAALFSIKSIEWENVSDLVASERFILVRDSKGQEIKIFHAEFGSVEPFEDLKESIVRFALPYAKLFWERKESDLLLAYPRLSLLTCTGYLIAFSVIALILISLALRVGYSAWFFWSSMVVAVLVIAPFLIRDILLSKRRLVVSQLGLSCDSSGRKVRIGWKEVGQIIVKEPLTVGYGAIIVKSKINESAITIPRAMKMCGYVLYLLQTKSGVPLTQSYDY